MYIQTRVGPGYRVKSVHLCYHSITMPPKTSGRAAKVAGKATKAIAKGDKKKRNKKRKESYAVYIYKVLKQVHPTLVSPTKP